MKTPTQTLKYKNSKVYSWAFEPNETVYQKVSKYMSGFETELKANCLPKAKDSIIYAAGS